MVGIVLVSHSQLLAQALVGMVRQMPAASAVPLAVAAGSGPDRQELGTDAAEVAAGIQAVFQPEGVLVLVDLGSALLSAELALELLPPETAARVKICPAPLVEGAIAAAVQAGLGGDLESAWREALGALEPKQAQLAQPSGTFTEPSPPGPPPAAAVQEVRLTLQNPHGLHARPAARFVQAAARFNARVQVRDLTNGRGPVPGNSLNALATLGAVQGHQIGVTASGPEAAQALAELERLVAGQFGERPPAPGGGQAQVFPAPAETEALRAVPVAEGIAVGPLLHYQPPPPLVPTHRVEDPDTEWERLQAAVAQVRREIGARRSQVAASLGEDQAAIFDAHQLILDDPVLLDEVHQQMWSDHKNAAAAWYAGLTALASTYAALEDGYLQGRAADLLDVGNQVLRALAGGPPPPPPELPEPAILLAQEVNPSQVAELNLDRVLGIITMVGGPTSHSAVLARSLGIPAVTGAPANLLRLPGGTPIALDGSSGTLWVRPSRAVQVKLQAEREAWLAGRQNLLAGSRLPATTRDGRTVAVVANAGSLQDAQAALRNGAEGIGVLRTEFLFLNRSTPPGEDEQVEVYAHIAAALEGHPVIVRTLDVGGDKELPYLRLTPERNPYLGMRGLRLSLQQTSLFSAQLRAILRAGARHPLKIMFPMVTDLGELLRARELVEAAHLSLQAAGLPHRWPVEVGIMIEVPAAALIAPAFAPHTDFFSLGTNDLTQYTLAAERGNPQLVNFADALHPAVLALIRQVVAAGHAHGKWVGVCGEIAGDPLAAPALVGLGVDELSLNPAGIPRVKAAVGATTYTRAQALAATMLAAEGAPAARKLAEEYYETIK